MALSDGPIDPPEVEDFDRECGCHISEQCKCDDEPW